MKNKAINWLLVAVGIILCAGGIIMLKLVSDPQGILRSLPYVCIGLGCGAFGHGLGDLISTGAIKNDPEIQKMVEINKNDERNIAISNRAKSKAYDIMLYVFGALMVSFAIMQVDLTVILLLVFAYLFVVFTSVYYLSKYNKEM